FLGNEKSTSNELWIKTTDILTHMLMLGTTGSGKTQALASIAGNVLSMGSGFSYIDPKAAPQLAAQIFALARVFGREDDFRIMNYLVAGKPSQKRHPKRISNTHNPFAFGSAESLTQLIVSLIPKSEGNNAVFGQNAQTLITALMFALKELAEMEEIELCIEQIRAHMTLGKYISLAQRKDLSASTIAALKNFLASVGWQQDVPLDSQPRSLTEQYGYARSYFGLALASLSDTYGHIYSTTCGEIDMFDIIKNRRILLTMMSPLEKSPQEITNLGNITLSSVKNAASTGLGTKIEGTVEEVVDALPTDSNTPFVSFTDEYAAISTPGYAEVLTQGRGLGIAAVVASQDFPGLKKADETGAIQIVANTKMKWFMKTLDPETYGLASQIASTAEVMQTSGFQALSSTGLFSGYQDQRTATVTRQERVNFRDLQEQIQGEFHALFEGRVVRGDAFYLDIYLDKEYQIRIHQMIPIQKQNKSSLQNQVQKAEQAATLMAALADDKKENQPDMPDKIRALHQGFSTKNESMHSRNPLALQAFFQYQAFEVKNNQSKKPSQKEGSANNLINCMEKMMHKAKKQGFL
ncbi:MAG: TraM recognition domain-containing protein, partial [Desulfobacteraceae bacterium]|nr:TraM recognition domain-containing protein [Desulfobacteraceae bacterium]